MIQMLGVSGYQPLSGGYVSEYQQVQPAESAAPVLTPAVVVDISPAARQLSSGSASENNAGKGEQSAGTYGPAKRQSTAGTQGCQTCSSRTYQDNSSDATVSFQSPTRVAPGGAESAVRAHEQEHVSNEQAKAGEEGRRVVFQSVTLQYAICTECGRSYVAGGSTTTVTSGKEQTAAAPTDSGGATG